MNAPGYIALKSMPLLWPGLTLVASAQMCIRDRYNTPSTNGSCQFKVKQKALPVYKFIYKEDALNADAGLRCGVNTWKEEAQKDGCAGHVVDSLFKYLSLSISSLKHIHPVGGQSTW